MVTTRGQRTREARRQANTKCILYKFPQEILLQICGILIGQHLESNGVHLFLRRQPARCKFHPESHCDFLPRSTRKLFSQHPTTLWHLMQASWALRNFARPLYMAHTIHLVCVQQLKAYQQSIFCDASSRCRFIRVHFDDYSSTPLLPLLDFNIYHQRIEVHYNSWWIGKNRERLTNNLISLVHMRNQVFMDTLILHAKDLTLDIEGNIRLVPDPYYFAAQPTLHGMMRDLAQLRLHTRAGLYVLLLPDRNADKDSGGTRLSRWAMNEIFEKDRRRKRRRIQKLLYHYGPDGHWHDIIPTKEFIASRCDLSEILVDGLLSRNIRHAVWLRIFPAVGRDVEEDGFEWEECGGEEDRDWRPKGDESEGSDVDDVVDWEREKMKRSRGKNIVDRVWKGEVEEHAAWESLEKLVVDGDEYVVSRAVLEAESKVWLPTLLRKSYGGVGLEVPTL